MAKETTFPHPPQGHAAILAWDSANKRWQAIYVDASGNLQVDVVASGLPSGAATAAKQLPDGHAVTVDNESIAVTGTFYPETQAVSEASPAARGAQLYCYDNGSWIPVATSNDDEGNPIVAIGRGANVAQMGNVGGDGVATTIKVLFTGGLLYAFNGTSWDRLRCNANKQLIVELASATVNAGVRQGSLTQLTYTGVPGDTGWHAIIDTSDKGILLSIDFMSDHASSGISLIIDGDYIMCPLDSTKALAATVSLSGLYGCGGESDWYKIGKYDTDNDLYTMWLKKAIEYNDTVKIEYHAGSATAAVSIALQVRSLT